MACGCGGTCCIFPWSKAAAPAPPVAADPRPVHQRGPCPPGTRGYKVTRHGRPQTVCVAVDRVLREGDGKGFGGLVYSGGVPVGLDGTGGGKLRDPGDGQKG